MIKIGDLALGAIPRVVLAVGDYFETAPEAYARGASILEIRIDLFSSFDSGFIKEQFEKYKKLNIPLIATLRPKLEGGKWEGSEEDRKKILLDCLSFVDAVDVELKFPAVNGAITKAVKKTDKTLIVSNHNFVKTPSLEILQGLVDEAAALGADIVKLACLAETKEDVSRMLEFTKKNSNKGMVGISMGATGAISRIAAPLFGSLLTYTSMNLDYGQLKMDDQIRMLRLLYPAFNTDFIKTRKITEKA